MHQPFRWLTLNVETTLVRKHMRLQRKSYLRLMFFYLNSTLQLSSKIWSSAMSEKHASSRWNLNADKLQNYAGPVCGTRTGSLLELPLTFLLVWNTLSKSCGEKWKSPSDRSCTDDWTNVNMFFSVIGFRNFIASIRVSVTTFASWSFSLS